MLQRFLDMVKKYPAFALYLTARTLTGMSFQIITVVVGWQIYAQTQSVFQLGLIGLAQFLPMFLLTIPAGHVADRYSRKHVVMVCQSVAALTGFYLALYSFMGWQSVVGLYMAVMVLGACRSFENPANAAFLPGLVPTQLLPRALAISSSASQTSFMVGPALGGFLYLAGPGMAYMVVGGCYAASVLLFSRIKLHHTPPAREPVSVKSLFSGFHYIWKKPVIFGAISLDMVAVLLGGATALLPVYAQDILHTGPVGLGILRAAPSVGAFVTSLWLARHPLKGHAGRKMFYAVMLFGAATVVFGISTNVVLSGLALLVMGAADVVSVVVRSTLVQLGTPDAMRGRVSAVNFMFIGTSNQLGEFESGVTAALFGTVPAVVIGGMGTIIVALVWMRLFPQLERVDKLEDVKA